MVRHIVAALVLVVVGLSQGGCGTGLQAPPQLTPIGNIAWYGDEILKQVAVIQQVAINGEAAGAISTNDARTIVAATGTLADAATTLGQALKAGSSATGAKAQAVAAIRSILINLPAKLSPETGKLIAQYAAPILTLLTALA